MTQYPPNLACLLKCPSCLPPKPALALGTTLKLPVPLPLAATAVPLPPGTGYGACNPVPVGSTVTVTTGAFTVTVTVGASHVSEEEGEIALMPSVDDSGMLTSGVGVALGLTWVVEVWKTVIREVEGMVSVDMVVGPESKSAELAAAVGSISWVTSAMLEEAIASTALEAAPVSTALEA